MSHLLHIFVHTLEDSVKLLPFLFVTYLAMEYIEHKMGDKAKETIERSGRFGPLFGGILGAFPQCGFSAAASNLYAGRIITLGTLIAVFLSTSDEMLPILISEQVSFSVILMLLGIKVLVGMIAGFLVDMVLRRRHKVGHGHKGHHHSSHHHGSHHHNDHEHEEEEHINIGHLCEHEHCHCEDGIFKSSVRHTLSIFLFIILIGFALNLVIHTVGEEFLAELILNRPVIGHLIAGIVGLIPNCASSVIITQLYLEGMMGLGVMMSGLLVGSGVGLLVLFRMNDNIKRNIQITLILYIIGVAAGILIDMIGIVIR